MKRFAMALALTCVLSTSIFAGNMPTDGRTQEPPPPGETQTPPAAMATLPEGTNSPPAETGILATVILTIITLPL